MNIDRFKNYGSEVRNLVLGFETMCRRNERSFYDVDELETIIDYYLEELDVEWMERAMKYAEEMYPDALEIKLRKAHICCVKGDYKRALRLLKEMEQIEPWNSDVMYAMGAVYSSQGESQKSIDYYEKASHDGFELGMVYGNIADEYYSLGDVDKAVEYYKRALAESDDEERSMENLCYCLCGADRAEEAEQYFEKLVYDEPYKVEGWFSLSAAYMAQEKWEQAIDACRYALTIDEKCEKAYDRIAECYCNMGELKKAIDVMHEELDWTEDKAEVYFSIGEMYFQLGNYESAIVYYKKAVEADAMLSGALFGMAKCYVQLEDYGTAITYGHRALALEPQSPLYICAVAHMHESYGEIDEADELFSNGVELNPNDDVCRVEYGEFLLRQEQYDDAIEVLNVGLVNAQFQLPYQVLLAVCYYRTGRRNFLFNAIRACVQYAEGADLREYFAQYPEVLEDSEVMDILNHEW